MSHTLVLMGNASYSNRGCEAIVRGTTAILRSRLGNCRFYSAYFPDEGCRDLEREFDAEIVHLPIVLPKRFELSWWRSQVFRIAGPHARDMDLYRHLREPVRSCDAVLMLGGDNYSLDYGNPRLYFSLNRFAHACGKPTVLWGVSVGPFTRDPEYERWAATELKKVSLICVRETLSLNYLRSIGVEDNVKLVADPAFWLEPMPVELPEDTKRALRQGCVGLNLIPLIARYRGISVSLWRDQMRQVVSELVKRWDGPVLLVPHVTSDAGEMGYRDDYLFMKEIRDELNLAPSRLLLLGPNYNAGQTKWVIGQLRAFAGTRTHSTIAAISSGVPTVFIAYSAKARGIANDVYGNTRWLIDAMNAEPEGIAGVVEDIVRDEQTVRAGLTTVLPRFREAALDAAGYLGQLIGADTTCACGSQKALG